MYSWEITKVMEKYNYCLPSQVYLDLTESSPQINHVAFDSCNSRFAMWDNEGEYWSFVVYYKAA